MRKLLALSVFILLACLQSGAQPLRFAVVSDLHIGLPDAEERLKAIVDDINRTEGLGFVVVLGDITDQGRDEQFQRAAKLLSRIQRKLYVLTGNRDTKFSDSWPQFYKKHFGGSRFRFEKGGYVFAGVPSGPYSETGPAFIRDEDLKMLARIPASKPVILLIHHELRLITNLDALKALPVWPSVAVELCGHLHVNRPLIQEDKPVLLCCSIMPNRHCPGGYNIAVIRDNQITLTWRNLQAQTDTLWYTGRL